MSAHKLNLGTALQFLLAFSLITSAVACGKKKKKAEGPCGAGVSQSSCGLGVRGHSAWSTQLTSYTQDPNTKQPVPGSERKITVTYEFKEAAPLSVWRRSIIVEAADGNKGMYQEGQVKKITGNTIEFVADTSSCDDSTHLAQGDFMLYYSRSQNNLTFDTKPIEPIKIKNVLDIFIVPIARAMGDGIRDLLEQAFTFGSAKTFLTSGHGSFSATNLKSAKAFEAKAVEIGCFSTLGSGYSKSTLRPEW